MNILAMIPAYNEADIIGWTVEHLRQQGLAVVVIDCHSSDYTVDIALSWGANCMTYDVIDGHVSWRKILELVEDVAAENIGRVDWCMLNDADEIRRSPSEGERLIDAFRRMDYYYNCAEFMVHTYHPIDNGYDGTQNPEEYFRYYTEDTLNNRIGQQKAWKNDRRVSIAWSGGHKLTLGYQQPYVCPIKLISKHYPIRSQAHGERKVFHERSPRWSDPEKDWHVQYAGIREGHCFLRRPDEKGMMCERRPRDNQQQRGTR